MNGESLDGRRSKPLQVEPTGAADRCRHFPSDQRAMTRAVDEQRRALAVLAENPDGCTPTSVLARGFSLPLLNQPKNSSAN
jgi:hypothetical protein